MAGFAKFAGWSLCWRISVLDGSGLEIFGADFQGRPVLLHASQPFVLVPYHTEHPVFKDGLAPTGTPTGEEFTALCPTAPNAHKNNLPPGSYAGNDDLYHPQDNPTGAVVVEEEEATFIEPAALVIWAKFQCGNYQYVHRWRFHADGSVHAEVGLGGKLSGIVQNGVVKKGFAHIHNFYFRLDFDINGSGANLVQRMDHAPLAGTSGAEGWTTIPAETKESWEPGKFRRWRVAEKTPKPNGKHRSYELIPGSEGLADGKYSSGDLWVLRAKGGGDLSTILEHGANVGVTDAALKDAYIGAAPEPVSGEDVVVWYCLRGHHLPRELGEENRVLPYHFLGFHLEPRDFLDDTPLSLYPTTPPSPFIP